MTNQHPITPPPELVQQWFGERYGRATVFSIRVASQAARWGADQELGACCEWLDKEIGPVDSCDLRADRRPNPLSLKEQALKTLHSMQIEPCVINRKGLDGVNTYVDLMAKYDILRRALEALPND